MIVKNHKKIHFKDFVFISLVILLLFSLFVTPSFAASENNMIYEGSYAFNGQIYEGDSIEFNFNFVRVGILNLFTNVIYNPCIEAIDSSSFKIRSLVSDSYYIVTSSSADYYSNGKFIFSYNSAALRFSVYEDFYFESGYSFLINFFDFDPNLMVDIELINNYDLSDKVIYSVPYHLTYYEFLLSDYNDGSFSLGNFAGIDCLLFNDLPLFTMYNSESSSHLLSLSFSVGGTYYVHASKGLPDVSDPEEPDPEDPDPEEPDPEKPEPEKPDPEEPEPENPEGDTSEPVIFTLINENNPSISHSFSSFSNYSFYNYVNSEFNDGTFSIVLVADKYVVKFHSYYLSSYSGGLVFSSDLTQGTFYYSGSSDEIKDPSDDYVDNGSGEDSGDSGGGTGGSNSNLDGIGNSSLPGYKLGYDAGFLDGKNYAQSSGLGRELLSNIFTAPVNALNSVVLSSVILDDGNVVNITLWSILSTLVVAILVLWFLKIVV